MRRHKLSKSLQVASLRRPRPKSEQKSEPRYAIPTTMLWVLLAMSAPSYGFLIWLISVKQVHAIDCPIVLDLNGNGEIDVSGLTTSSRNVYSFFFLPRFVEFDLRGTGQKSRIDWVLPNTDGFLVDLRRGTPPSEIDGTWLFANTEHADGFEKLKEFDDDSDGELRGSELSQLGLWVDNGDAVLQPNELLSLSQYGIEGIPTLYEVMPGPFGGTKMAAHAQSVEGGIYMEDVWFLSLDELSEADRRFAGLGLD